MLNVEPVQMHRIFIDFEAILENYSMYFFILPGCEIELPEIESMDFTLSFLDQVVYANLCQVGVYSHSVCFCWRISLTAEPIWFFYTIESMDFTLSFLDQVVYANLCQVGIYSLI